MPTDQYITIAILDLTFALLIKSKIPPVATNLRTLSKTVCPDGRCGYYYNFAGATSMAILILISAIGK